MNHFSFVSCFLVVFAASLLGIEAFSICLSSCETVHQRALSDTRLQLSKEPDIDGVKSRRDALRNIIVGGSSMIAASLVGTGITANALDMDAFIKAELDADTKNCDPKKDPKCVPELTKDQALCQYGQSGNARAEACKRVKASGGDLPDVQKARSLGGAYAM